MHSRLLLIGAILIIALASAGLATPQIGISSISILNRENEDQTTLAQVDIQKIVFDVRYTGGPTDPNPCMTTIDFRIDSGPFTSSQVAIQKNTVIRREISSSQLPAMAEGNHDITISATCGTSVETQRKFFSIIPGGEYNVPDISPWTVIVLGISLAFFFAQTRQ